LHIRQANRNVDARGALDRPWLQRHGISRAAEQEILSDADTNTDVATGTHVIAGEASGHHLVGGSEYAPGQRAPGREAEINAQRGHGAGIELRWTDFRCESAIHPLKANDNQTHGGGDIAIENANLRAWPPADRGEARNETADRLLAARS
jgi:hypothetical protein